MALVPIDSVIFLSEVNKKKYSDVGVVNLGYQEKYNLYNTSKRILDALLAYRDYISEGNTVLSVYVECTEGKFFWLDWVYLNYKVTEIDEITGEVIENTINISVDFKKSIEYLVLSSKMLNNFVLIFAYENYWKKCLRYVGSKIGVNLKEDEV